MNIRERAETFTRYIGLELKGKITTRGYSAKQVAEGIGRQPAAFNRWLNGKVEIPLSVLCEACEFIDVEPRDIVESAYDRLAVDHGERDGSIYGDEESTLATTPGGVSVIGTPLNSSSAVGADYEDEDFDVTPRGVTQADVALAAKRGKKKADEDAAE